MSWPEFTSQIVFSDRKILLKCICLRFFVFVSSERVFIAALHIDESHVTMDALRNELSDILKVLSDSFSGTKGDLKMFNLNDDHVLYSSIFILSSICILIICVLNSYYKNGVLIKAKIH